MIAQVRRAFPINSFGDVRGEEMIRGKRVFAACLSWTVILSVGALALTGCSGPNAGLTPSGPYYGEAYETPPQYSYGGPWVGTNTPWVFYQGDWFYNGMLYYFFGPQYGWAPYYAYPPTYIVRTTYYYSPKWTAWYHQHPQYVQTFTRRYPYWHNHHAGQRYDQNFYNRYHQGQGGGWQKGFQGIQTRPFPEGRKPAQPEPVPPQGHRPGAYSVTQPAPAHSPERLRPVPGQGTSPAFRGTGSTPAASYQGQPAPVQQQPQYQRQQQFQQPRKPQQFPPQQPLRPTQQPPQAYHPQPPQQPRQPHQPQPRQQQQKQQHQEKKGPQQPGQP